MIDAEGELRERTVAGEGGERPNLRLGNVLPAQRLDLSPAILCNMDMVIEQEEAIEGPCIGAGCDCQQGDKSQHYPLICALHLRRPVRVLCLIASAGCRFYPIAHQAEYGGATSQDDPMSRGSCFRIVVTSSFAPRGRHQTEAGNP